MNRQLYQMGGSIEQARDFFMREKGLDANQTESLIAQGLQAFNTITQPQSMMQMASNGGRIGYQMGGITSMPMDFGQPLQVPQQTSMPMQPMMSSPMANYGETPLMMADGGVAGIYPRQGYFLGKRVSAVATPQSGGGAGGGRGIGGMMSRLIQQNPQMFRPVVDQQRLLNASSLNRDFIDLNENGIDDREEEVRAAQGGRIGYQMGGEADMSQMGGMGMSQMNEQQALETIIQLLIEQGIPKEQALILAAQILQIFAEGGAPAVEKFADQVEQEEQMQMMAGGGIAGLYPREGYFVGKLVKSIGKGIGKAVKGVGKAIKKVAQSPIGRIAITVGANMLLPGAGSAFGAALQAAAVNLGVQAIGGGKINLLEAGLAGLGGYASFGGPGALSGDPSTINQGGLTDAQLQAAGQTSNLGGVNVPINEIKPVPIDPDIGSYSGSVQNITNQGLTVPEFTKPFGTLSDYPGIEQGSPLSRLGPEVPKPTYFESVKAVAKDPSLSGIKYLATEGVKNLGTTLAGTYDKIADNIIPLATGAVLGKYVFGSPQQPDEPDEDFAKRQQEEANASITQFGRNLQIRNPYFYQRYGAEDPFAVKTAAQGGIMGYAAGGSMIPPARRIEGGVIELDARKTGGYIPYGKKERVDDVPAMLAKDEFVFTSRAVKGAGDGSARRGAAKMYKLMKQLEAKGKKMERGARA